ncbi:MAG: ImmA/IrrE family metallo-endopeptidase [Gemmatimonadota bacterium]
MPHIKYPVDLDAVVYDHLCERHGLYFNDEADLNESGACDDVLGKTLPVSGRILINRELKARGEEGRYRFTVAHELGHWILHRPLVLAAAAQPGLFEDAEQYEFVSLNRDVFAATDRRAVPREEWQANRFAVALLIGRDRLRDEFVARFGPPPVVRAGREAPGRAATPRDLANQLATAQVNTLPQLRDVFGLSAEAMAIALESRGYVAENGPLV